MPCAFELEAQNSIHRNQASVAMRLGTGMSRTEFAFLARSRATSRARDSLYLFESWLLGLHDCQFMASRTIRMFNFAQSTRIISEESDFTYPMKEDVKKKRFFPPLGKMRMW